MNPAVTNLAVETAWSDHVTVLPVVLPIAVAGTMFLLDERRRRLKASLSFATILALIAIAVTPRRLGLGRAARLPPRQLGRALRDRPRGRPALGDDAGPVLGAGALRAGLLLRPLGAGGPRFHGLFLLLLMGVNGAFLTGDLFNLFVFFEVMLAASYGLVLHGSGETRIRAGLGYIAVNLVASLFFLVGVSLIYGTMGTLNMADLARRLAGPRRANSPCSRSAAPSSASPSSSSAARGPWASGCPPPTRRPPRRPPPSSRSSARSASTWWCA